VLVAPQLEVVERVGPVAPHELARSLSHLDSREEPRGRQRPEEQVGAPRERDHAGCADRLVQVSELVVKVERPDLPEQRVARLAEDRAEAGGLGGGDPDRQPAEEEARGGEQRHAFQRGAQRVGIVTDAEGAASDPEHYCGGDAARRRLEIEAFQQVEQRQAGEQHEREPERALPAPPEVRSRDEEQHRGRHGGRVGEPQRFEGLDVEQQVVSPGDVRLDRGREVDEAGERRDHRGELRERVGAAHGPQRVHRHVQPEPPGGGVAVRGKEVAPVFGDQPDADERGGCGSETGVDAVGERAHAQPEQQGDPKMPLVNAGAHDVDTGPESMSVDSEHASLLGTR
jgi:hypothetical protein